MSDVSEWLQELIDSVSVRPPIALALLLSIALVVWGNVVVLRSRTVLRTRGKRAAERSTLLAHTGAALVTLAAFLAAGFSAGDLGLGPPRFHRLHPLVLVVLVVVALVVIVFLVVGLIRRRDERDGVWIVEAARLLIATAGGEEFLFRGFLLALWAGTGTSTGVILSANMLSFGLWHLAGARKNGRLIWGEVLGPGVFAVVFLAARLAFDSLLFPWLLHAAINLPGLALDLKKPPEEVHALEPGSRGADRADVEERSPRRSR
jgi:membrane protease YdiL (CAAX protease family)